MTQDWQTPQTAASQPATTQAANAPRLPQGLRPLSVGEILDRTFSVYRSRFWLFAGIAAVYAASALALQLLNLLARHFVVVRYGFRTGTMSALGGSMAMASLLLVPYAVTEAATVFALGEVYLGKGTTAGTALRGTVGRWYRYVGIALWIGFSFAWAPFLLWTPAFVIVLALDSTSLAWLAGLLFFLGFCALPYSVWALLRNLLAVPAAVIEGTSLRASMRRSKTLSRGAKVKMGVVLLVTGALTMTTGVLQVPLLLVVAKSPLQEHNVAQAISLIVNAFAQVVVLPVGLIGLSLVYFDQRVRQEGFDLLLMLGPQQAPASPLAGSSTANAELAPAPAAAMGADGPL